MTSGMKFSIVTSTGSAGPAPIICSMARLLSFSGSFEGTDPRGIPVVVHAPFISPESRHQAQQNKAGKTRPAKQTGLRV